MSHIHDKYKLNGSWPQPVYVNEVSFKIVQEQVNSCMVQENCLFGWFQVKKKWPWGLTLLQYQ